MGDLLAIADTLTTKLKTCILKINIMNKKMEINMLIKRIMVCGMSSCFVFTGPIVALGICKELIKNTENQYTIDALG